MTDWQKGGENMTNREKLIQFLEQEGYTCDASYIDDQSQGKPFQVDEYSHLGIEVRFTSTPEIVFGKGVAPETVCEYKDCKQEADYWVSANEIESENGGYTYRCTNHLYK